MINKRFSTAASTHLNPLWTNRLVNIQALKSAAHLVLAQTNFEEWSRITYQIVTCLLMISPVFLAVTAQGMIVYLGLVIWIFSLLLLALASFNFAQTAQGEFCQKGLYQLSRHPIYVAYFIYFWGLGLLLQSRLFFLLIVIFQISTHGLILMEERWCQEQFGQSYDDYQKKVGLYL